MCDLVIRQPGYIPGLPEYLEDCASFSPCMRLDAIDGPLIVPDVFPDDLGVHSPREQAVVIRDVYPEK